MKIILDDTDLRPMIESVVAETLRQVKAIHGQFGERLAFTESEAAALLGIQRHVLRDCRRRGEIKGAKCGKRILYRLDDLTAMLERNLVS